MKSEKNPTNRITPITKGNINGRSITKNQDT
jgi:hypothetical protein